MSFGDLSGKRIVVTGASSGIGAAIALECAVAGAEVVIGYRQSHRAAIEVAERIASVATAPSVFAVDVSDEAARKAFFDECRTSGRVDALVNNAGADLLTGPLKDVDFSVKLQTLLDVDVAGTVRMSRLFAQLFQDQQQGSILNVGWDQSDRGMEGDSGELFATAKNAIMGFTRSLAVSLAPSVRVNCIAPGWIKTAWGEGTSDYWHNRVMEETPLKRWGLPKDIAAMARFLLSDDASFITGQVINVNGGAVR